jgi:ComF family protein
MVRPLLDALMDALYPPQCALCGRMGEPPICDGCRAEMPAFGNPIPGPTPLTRHQALYRYEDRAAQAVRRLKFDRATSLAAPMAAALAAVPRDPGQVVIPVPIHWTRGTFRGFNQADLLAEGMASRPELLRRIRRTRPQIGLPAARRLTNLRGAFLATPEVHGRAILLVDDVLTTGGTAIACAEALLAQGAQEVAILTFAADP